LEHLGCRNSLRRVARDVGTAPCHTKQILHTVEFYSANPHAQGTFFHGQAMADPGIAYYCVVLAFAMTPATMVGLAATTATLAARRSKPLSSRPRSLGMILLYAAAFCVMMSWGAKKQGRYLLPALVALDIVAAWGLVRLARWLQIQWITITSKSGHWRAVLGFIILLTTQLAVVLPHHPYYLTYHNPLLGGLPVAARWIDVGWGEGLEQAASYLNAQPDATNQQAITWLGAAFAPYYHGHTVAYATTENTPIPQETDYLVRYIAEQQRGLTFADAKARLETATLEHTIRLYGVDYVWIYRLKH